MDMAHLQKWIGKQETRRELIAAFPSNALATTLNRDDPEYGEGTPLPPLWHWLHFLPIYKLKDAGYDGHNALGGFMPPVPLPRRMWAGSRLKFLAPMRIGRKLRKISTIGKIDHKRGSSGELVFVTVRHEVFDGDIKGIEEEHDIVYREPVSQDAKQPTPTQVSFKSEFSRIVNPDPTMLFRYSALTFNGHRIHYDHPFCTETEGYEGLVVHGPLLATLLLDLLRQEMPDANVETFDFRALAPVFETRDFSIHGKLEEDGKTVPLWVKRHDGALAMDAKARISQGK